MAISPKPTSGESARFHLSDYRLVARHNFRVARDLPIILNSRLSGNTRMARSINESAILRESRNISSDICVSRYLSSRVTASSSGLWCHLEKHLVKMPLKVVKIHTSTPDLAA
jgi:hypothetical protein